MAAIIIEHTCLFEKELPIKAVPIRCNGKRVVATKSLAGWVAKIDDTEVETPCGKKTLSTRAYIKNVIVPTLGDLDLSVLDQCAACDATGDCRPLSGWITNCYIRRVIVHAVVPVEFVASYVKAMPLYAFSKSSIKAGNCKFKFKRGNACMHCVYENSRGIPPEFVGNLSSILSTFTV